MVLEGAENRDPPRSRKEIVVWKYNALSYYAQRLVPVLARAMLPLMIVESSVMPLGSAASQETRHGWDTPGRGKPVQVLR